MKEQEYSYSFIIPHKNCPALLQRCVDSIPERDDVQIIVVDDNSDEANKPNIVREGVEIVLLDANQCNGAGHARNVGLSVAKGKWCLFADADDYYNEGFLNVLGKYVDSEQDVIYFNAEYRDGLTNTKLDNLDFMNEFFSYDGSVTMQDTIKYHHNVPWNKMVKKKFIDKYSIYFEETPNGNDILFSIFVGYLCSNFEVIKSPLYVYLKNPGSLVTDKKNTTSKRLCRLIHTVKHNRFYQYINHPEWETNIIIHILYETKMAGLLAGVTLTLAFVRNFFKIIKEQDEWITIINKKLTGNC